MEGVKAKKIGDWNPDLPLTTSYSYLRDRPKERLINLDFNLRNIYKFQSPGAFDLYPRTGPFPLSFFIS